ncbi:LysR family transcriptional regulator [Compostimonas suwonensis]|uniref:DNA-binding transcriptional LysR family regulator n=1 Tax=Compostimonas suwonensis TaxID=1048394 RepID=A0A2M9BU91_9MICO|nr:LysR family transcriptional regulator [Compostimonas suwonensis]PJJ61482.1 DNA-binding transcriptional LysR family regulator [Compostimonas suwonensis]
MTLPDVRRLMVLRELKRSGGVQAAAQSLGITASAVSQHLAKLEAETGLGLVVRAGNSKLTLTPAGLRLAARADAIADELVSASSDISELRGAHRRTVTVAAFPTAIQSLVAPAAAVLGAEASAVTVRIVEDRDGSGIRALRAGAADIVIAKRETGEDALADEGMSEDVLIDDPYRIVVPASWPPPAALSELYDSPWVGLPDGMPGALLETIERRDGVRLRREHECVEYPAVLAIVAAGLAAAVVPMLALPEPGGVRVLGAGVPGVGELGSRRIVARYRTEFPRLVPAARFVLDQLAERAAVAAR